MIIKTSGVFSIRNCSIYTDSFWITENQAQVQHSKMLFLHLETWIESLEMFKWLIILFIFTELLYVHGIIHINLNKITSTFIFSKINLITLNLLGARPEVSCKSLACSSVELCRTKANKRSTTTILKTIFFSKNVQVSFQWEPILVIMEMTRNHSFLRSIYAKQV